MRSEIIGVRPPKQSPLKDSTRPPEPLRPAPAKQMNLSLLAAKARRQRHRLLPPSSGFGLHGFE